MFEKRQAFRGVPIMSGLAGFAAFVEMEGGELVKLATYPSRAQAEEAVKSFQQHWPATYAIREIRASN
jgi:hypothetical protein